MTGSDRATVARRAVVCLDLTNLDDDCDEQAVAELCRRAQTPAGSVAAVCVWPAFAAQAKAALARTGIKVAAVVNFPRGDGDPQAVREETRAALAAGADEIDLVTPWRAVARGDAGPVAALVREIKGACGAAPLKAILETGELADPALIALAAGAAIDGGADFLKTSTGKVPVNATPEAARILLETIARRGGSVGFKAAGGVRTVEQAGVYLALADTLMGSGWAGPRRFRIGASGLLDTLLATLGAEDADEEEDAGDY